MNKELNQYVKKCRKNKMRVRSIFLRLRNMKKYSGYSDIVLLNILVGVLEELNLPFSSREIHSAFKEVSKTDYEEKFRRAIIKSMTQYYKNCRSVFK